MRQGPDYTQIFEWDKRGRPVVTVPLELVADFEDSACVRFHDNGDGSFKLTVFDNLSDID